MAQLGTIYRILVASPSDCSSERKAIPEVIHVWNSLNSMRTSAILEPVLWETHARPELGDRPQALINKQLVNDCDLLVGAFWTRLGTDTGEAESGTVEEINKFRAAGKPVMLYVSAVPVVPSSIDADQYRRLREYLDKVRGEGIVFSYDSIGQLREMVLLHLTSTVAELHRTQAPASAESRQNAQTAFRIFASNFTTYVKRLEAEWSSERDSGPYSLDEGRYILRSALAELVTFMSQIDAHQYPHLAESLRDATKLLRGAEKHIDSARSFWRNGDNAIDALQRAAQLISDHL